MINWLKRLFRKPPPCKHERANHGWWRDGNNILFVETMCPDCGWHDSGHVMESHNSPNPPAHLRKP